MSQSPIRNLPVDDDDNAATDAVVVVLGPPDADDDPADAPNDAAPLQIVDRPHDFNFKLEMFVPLAVAFFAIFGFVVSYSLWTCIFTLAIYVVYIAITFFAIVGDRLDFNVARWTDWNVSLLETMAQTFVRFTTWVRNGLLGPIHPQDDPMEALWTKYFFVIVLTIVNGIWIFNVVRLLIFVYYGIFSFAILGFCMIFRPILNGFRMIVGGGEDDIMEL